jgi:hypothetical protein
VLARGLDEVQPHRHVREEVSPGVLPVRPDPADLRRQVQDDVRLVVLVDALRARLARQLILAPPRHDDVRVPARRELLDDKAAEKPGPAGDDDAIALRNGHEGLLPTNLANLHE